MNMRILALFVSAIIALSGMAALGTATPAAAAPAAQTTASDDVGVQDYYTRLFSNAYLFDFPNGTRIRTVHKGNIFHVYQICRFHTPGIGDRWWAYGHSSEAPRTNGWILAFHLLEEYHPHNC